MLKSFIIILLIFVFTPLSVFADCPNLPHSDTSEIPRRYWYSDSGPSSYTYVNISGSLGGFSYAKYRSHQVSYQNAISYYNCSCESFIPPLGSPYDFDPNNPPLGYSSGNPADSDNGGPPSGCNCTIERVCYNSLNAPVYYELDCCGTLHVYGNISLSVRCFRTDGVNPGPPVGLGNVPPLIQDPDNGWVMPPVYSGPLGDYDQPDSADAPDTDGDGIPDYADLKPNGLADGSDNPRWRETSYTLDVDGNKVGGTYKVEGQEGEYRWGAESASYDPATGAGDYINIGGDWQSPESFANNSSGGGWSSSGGGGGAISSFGSYDPFAIPVDPQNPTDEEIAEWEATDPPPPIDFGEVQQPEETYETGSGTSGDVSAVVDADLSEVSKILAGIEQDQKGYGSATIEELEKITELLRKNVVIDDPNSSNDPSTEGGYYCHWTTYFDDGVECGWLLKLVKDPEIGGYTEYMIGQTSSVSEAACCVWHPASEMWDASNPWSSGGGNQGWVGDGSGSGSGVTGDEILQALTDDRAAGNSAAETARSIAEASLDASGEPTYSPYEESDIPDYSQDQIDYETELNNLSNNSSISSVRDSLGIQTSAPTSSMSCSLCGQTITFDFSPHASLLQNIGTMWVSLCYLSGFLIIMRS